MRLFEILKRSFVVLMLSFMAVGMLGACSSSEEESSSGGGQSCAEQCANEQEGRQDECLLACEA